MPGSVERERSRMEDEIQRMRIQRRINQIGREGFALECLLAEMTNEELKRIIPALPEVAQDEVYQILDDLEGV